jgi:twitching motility protein PilI
VSEQQHADKRRSAEALIGLLQDIARRSQAHADILPQQVESVRFWEGILFSVGGERFVSPLNEIVEILNYPHAVTQVPGTRPWVRGIANIRGNLLPIIDLQAFLGGGRTATGRRSRVLVMHLGELFTGLLVGQMVGMRHFDEADRTECRTIDGSTARFVTGAFEYDGEVLPVFSMQALANSPDFMSVAV